MSQEKPSVTEIFNNQGELSSELEKLHGKKLISHEVNEMTLELKFEDGTTLIVNIWDDYNDKPGFGNVEFER